MDFLEAVRFLTTIPIPSRKAPTTEVAVGSAYFPLVGALIGGLLVLISRLLTCLWSAQLVSVILTVAWVVLTGGMHLDGLADTSDAMLSRRTRAQKLAIMKDSSVGTFGALAVFCALLLKVAFLNELSIALQPQALALTPALGRWALVQAAFFYPAAREEGMGRFFSEHVRARDFVVATLLMVGLAFLLLRFWGLVVFGGIWLMAALINRSFSKALGGLTGDTYGALCEISEVLALAMIALLEGVIV
jgi:adenosylcobinamide-GDP ribazoletransferase